MKKISLVEIKHALLDHRFREKLPSEIEKEVTKFLNNPNCACNHPFYKKIASEFPDLLKEYYPNKEVDSLEKEIQEISKNDWHVINCSIHELQQKLRELPPGRKQLDITRWQDQVTVVINNLDLVF